MEILSPSLKLFRIISDETRLKILMILDKSEFTVGELVRVLNIHQSNTSRHLQQLREGELVEDRREGALVYYRLSEALRASTDLQTMLRFAWQALSDRDAVEQHLEIILLQRRQQTQQFFDSVAGRYSKLAEPGGGAEPLLKTFGSLLNFDHAVDIGCGEGDITLFLARGCKQVTAVDQNRKMLDIIQERCARNGVTNVHLCPGELGALPLGSESADLVILSQVLHHAPSPTQALAESIRILKPQGSFVLLDLLAHDQEWVREKLGDLWLGLAPERVRLWLLELGMEIQCAEVVHVPDGLPTILVIAKKA